MSTAPTLLTEGDIALFFQGKHTHLQDLLGAHPMVHEGKAGTYFAVWAPNAGAVFVTGTWNDWSLSAHPMVRQEPSGIWELHIPGVGKGEHYKYHVAAAKGPYRIDKADPFAFHSEVPSDTASVVWDLDYEWGDKEWMAARREKMARSAPMAIYEVHLGSWRRKEDEENRSLTYREIAQPLAEHLLSTGFTHVELTPVMVHPYLPSWGYQITGYFAPTSRYGTPQDFMYLVDYLHRCGIGVILDWVPSHFPSDGHALSYFDGTHLYEHADPRLGYHPDWKSLIFNYGRHEVRSFLLSSALFWIDRYHADALRVDGVASMLYLDYSRKAGEWIPNQHGGRENLDAIAVLRDLNETIYTAHPDAQTIAEESTSWPLVTRPAYVGGLGFGYKWDMGWMHDTLRYFALDPILRKFNHKAITFRMFYAFAENFILPLSHDEVVHGKSSLLGKMSGDIASKFANLRLLFGYMYGQSGKKLIFMGGEFGQWREWSQARSLDWDLLEYPSHAGLMRWVTDLNKLYVSEPALHEQDCEQAGFELIDCNDLDNGVVSFVRKGLTSGDEIVVVCSFTPVPRHNYVIGAPTAGFWKELLNSDAVEYGGKGKGNFGGLTSDEIPKHGRPYSLQLTLPPLSVLFLKRTEPEKPVTKETKTEPAAAGG